MSGLVAGASGLVAPESRSGWIDRAPRRIAGAAPSVADATLVGREDLTEAVALFRVRPDDGPRPFVPGQYLSLGLEIDGRVIRRPYSTSSAPGSLDLEFLIRRVAGGTFTPALWRTRRGGRLLLGRAKGLFTLDPGDHRAHLFVSTGTGLAPFVAMLGSLHQRPRWPRVVVVHGVAHADELAYRSLLVEAATAGHIGYVPTVSRPGEPRNAGWRGASGRVSDVIPELFDGSNRESRGRLDPRDTVAYLCGSPAMIASTTARLIQLGLPPQAIVSERYWPGEAG
jgi:ferredoxin/flavodoxin---NADP+ reductase